MTTGHEDWNERIERAQEMIPLLHQLRRKNIVTSIFGSLLDGVTDIDIVKAHRYARRIAGEELSTSQTLPILQELVQLDLGPASIDLGQLLLGFEAAGAGDLRAYLESELAPVIGTNEKKEPVLSLIHI